MENPLWRPLMEKPKEEEEEDCFLSEDYRYYLDILTISSDINLGYH